MKSKYHLNLTDHLMELIRTALTTHNLDFKKLPKNELVTNMLKLNIFK